jgi:hypothetical protein
MKGIKMKKVVCKDCKHEGGTFYGGTPKKPYSSAWFFIDTRYCKIWDREVLAITTCDSSKEK